MIRTGHIQMKPTAEFTQDLVCPRCGSDYLHHLGAVFYDRREDAEAEVKITVSGPQVSTEVVDARTSGNPSGRRHGMAIQFSCENCSGKHGPLELTIAQHKGNTEVGWRFDPA
ncbi:hypothetical protein [Mesorhizobium sp. M4B.F.Ca.ET.058.02.1.1]|uniref:hypothetical protein n=1 Tax=Mesorhizobium sp. M4B.F.Ca.ET.058.02.1.1 TaxID=2493675 RepID=UPI000F75C458|nr:hypothetical protein [Mesorhizobium sp. M4B.F.Ca.ET.058.02.1.1]AZO51240.1 hypothetical protein EJ073_28575 [Mesorhizobium sp. M4B.F.Ca.ET.058.02.1.1]